MSVPLRLNSALRVVTVVLFLAFMCIFWMGPVAHAASHVTTNVASPGKCIVTQYYLHGTQPATKTCLKYQTTSGNQGVSPNTSIGSCSNPNATLWSTGNGEVCFTGTGYLGLTGCCTGVYKEYFAGCCYGWVLYYNSPTGVKYYMSGETTQTNSWNSVTQICIDQYSGSAPC